MITSISIIGNFYNSKKYIPKLLKSIANQTFTNWYLICVDDCSPSFDNKTIAEWSKKLGINEKVTIIRNTENLGISKAKEVGINYVKKNFSSAGYTTFIDGDDWLEPQALELLYNEAYKQNTEVVIANYYRTYKIGPLYKKKLHKANIKSDEYGIKYEQADAIERFLLNFLGVNIYNVAYWSKLYSNGLLERLDFDFRSKENSAYEDLFFSLAVLLQCKSLTFLEKPTYNWRWGGIMSGIKNDEWNAFHISEQFISNYIPRKAIIEKYNYEKGRYFLMAELKNVTFHCWSNLAKPKPDSNESKDIKRKIEILLQEPAFDDFRLSYPVNLPKTELQKEFLDGVYKNDIEEIYRCCHKYWKTNYKYKIKSITRWFGQKLH